MDDEKGGWSSLSFGRRLLKYTVGVDLLSVRHLPSLEIFQKWDSNPAHPELSRSSFCTRWLHRVVQVQVPQIAQQDKTNEIEESKKGLDISLNKESRAQQDDSVLCGDAAPIRICIIGAGISGLYLAMMLDDLGIPGLSYDILESRNRVGGRVYTHYFGDQKETESYYDIGAMRFPKIPPLARTFDLFSRCGVALVPYTYENPKSPRFYNGLTIHPDKTNKGGHDHFRFGISQGGIVPDKIILENPNAILQRAVEPFIARLAKDFHAGFEYLMKFDHLTMREYLTQEIKLDFSSIWYLETVCSASGLYDKAFTEAVLDAMDFHYPTETGLPPEWYRVSGGTSQVVQTMSTGLVHKPLLEHRVKSIVHEPDQCDYPMSVHVDGEDVPRQYSAVFSTAPLPCLRRMHLGPGTLSAQQRAAVQSVHYDDSTKIAVRFRTPWWRTIFCISGGQATTDLPIRTCVYPSDDSTVLLCSYTWGQDAHQMGSLLNCSSKSARRHLQNLVLDNLALLHQGCIDNKVGTACGYARMRRLLDQEFQDIHGHHWGGDPDSSGAFAYFGPGQFRAFYPALVEPAGNGRMFLVGEACSAHHGWIAGSLESSYRAIQQYLSLLQSSRQVDAEKLEQLQQSWGLK